MARDDQRFLAMSDDEDYEYDDVDDEGSDDEEDVDGDFEDEDYDEDGGDDFDDSAYRNEEEEYEY